MDFFQKGLMGMGKQKVGSVGDISPGSSKLVMVEGQPVAIFNVSGKFFAIGDRCTHRGGPLHEGERDGNTVTCPWHGAQFDITTGKNVGPPAPSPVPAYNVSIEGNDVFIDS